MGELDQITQICRKIRDNLGPFIHSLYTEDYPHDIVDIYSGKLSTDEVNVDQSMYKKR